MPCATRRSQAARLRTPPRRHPARLLAGLPAGIVLLLLLSVPAQAATRFFLVAEIADPCLHCDAYVLPLSDPAHIQRAEELIAGGATLPFIAVAQIAAGADGVNRNHLAAEVPPWSWHVTGFFGFAELTVEVCDGWPGLVEQNVDAWILSTGGQVCFWSYTVVSELPAPPRPVPSAGAGSLALLAALMGVAGVHMARARLERARVDVA